MSLERLKVPLKNKRFELLCSLHLKSLDFFNKKTQNMQQFIRKKFLEIFRKKMHDSEIVATDRTCTQNMHQFFRKNKPERVFGLQVR